MEEIMVPIINLHNLDVAQLEEETGTKIVVTDQLYKSLRIFGDVAGISNVKELMQAQIGQNNENLENMKAVIMTIERDLESLSERYRQMNSDMLDRVLSKPLPDAAEYVDRMFQSDTEENLLGVGKITEIFTLLGGLYGEEKLCVLLADEAHLDDKSALLGITLRGITGTWEYPMLMCRVAKFTGAFLHQYVLRTIDAACDFGIKVLGIVLGSNVKHSEFYQRCGSECDTPFFSHRSNVISTHICNLHLRKLLYKYLLCNAEFPDATFTAGLHKLFHSTIKDPSAHLEYIEKVMAHWSGLGTKSIMRGISGTTTLVLQLDHLGIRNFNLNFVNTEGVERLFHALKGYNLENTIAVDSLRAKIRNLIVINNKHLVLP